MVPEKFSTSMNRDGSKDGFDLELTAAVSDAVSVPVIASGGVGNLQHLVDGITKGHADAVLAASIFHYGEYTVGQAKRIYGEPRNSGSYLKCNKTQLKKILMRYLTPDRILRG